MADSIYEGSPRARVRALLRKPEDISFYMLGEGLIHAYAPPDVACSAPYVEIGKEFLDALEFELYELLCDTRLSEPKEWATQFVEGDARDLTVGIITLLMAHFETTLAIAVPATALIVRKRLLKLCLRKPRRPKQSVRAIMARMKRMWRRHGR